MNKKELIEAIMAQTGATKAVTEKMLDAFTDTVTKQLKKGNSVKLVGFGTFEVVKRSARKGRNPQTGEEVKIKATKAPKFKPGKTLKDAIAGVKK